jgi:hypothetical protein
MEQYSIFISHAAVDEEIADALKDLLREAFPTLRVFVSSDPEDLPPGTQWVGKILSALETAQIMLVLTTDRGLSRKWVWFETGRFWFSGVPSIPCCVGKVRKSQLPSPFSDLQGLNIDDESDLRRLLGTIDNTFGGRSGKTDPAEFVRNIIRLNLRAEEREHITSDPLVEERKKDIEKKMKSFSSAEQETFRQFAIHGELTTSAARDAVRETGVDMEKWSVPCALTRKVGWILARDGNRMDDPYQTNSFYINPEYRALLADYFRKHR